MRASAAVLFAFAADSASAATIHAKLSSGRSLTLIATHADQSPPLTSALAGPKSLALFAGGNGCSTLSAPSNAGTFVLHVRAGGCTFDEKMRTAFHAGAAALIVSKTLAQQYNFDDAASSTAATLTLDNPCAVDCGRGRGVVDASSVSTSEVLAGLPGRCPSIAYDHVECTSGLCAFAGPGLNASSSSRSSREVCCALDTFPLQMLLPNASSSGVPSLYLPLSLGQLLETECTPPASLPGASSDRASSKSSSHPGPRRSACEVTLLAEDDEPEGSGWDGSALVVWFIGVGTAALAAYLAGTEQDAEDREIAVSLKVMTLQPRLLASCPPALHARLLSSASLSPPRLARVLSSFVPTMCARLLPSPRSTPPASLPLRSRSRPSTSPPRWSSLRSPPSSCCSSTSCCRRASPPSFSSPSTSSVRANPSRLRSRARAHETRIRMRCLAHQSLHHALAAPSALLPAPSA